LCFGDLFNCMKIIQNGDTANEFLSRTKVIECENRPLLKHRAAGCSVNTALFYDVLVDFYLLM